MIKKKIRHPEICNCSCTHSFQDTTYGVQMRVWTFAPGNKTSGKENRFRCTVCGKEKDIREKEKEKEG